MNVTPADFLGVNAGDIYLGGAFSEGILRLDSSGFIDGAFMVSTGFDAEVTSMALGTSEDIYVGGAFTTYDGVSASGLVRLDDDGMRDNGFNVGSGFTDPDGVFPFSKVASVVQETRRTMFLSAVALRNTMAWLATASCV